MLLAELNGCWMLSLIVTRHRTIIIKERAFTMNTVLCLLYVLKSLSL